ncbi:putative mitochondrial calcium uniporter regulator 1 [Scophthalmus maximus]|uniref:Putative mitochondrial calcium uniporter regulator 1 n=1 Tax=Scophthalmus maximus TaxID=52904 RepID=A0A2U9CYI3_SCOMX|nr:mitochondrial calcium uniporter regulator 1 isoform X2 [Scophthalmus maximus]AWP20899.1 putative mitochondrial calcium uniporter regulator 1 [Scophthalmus maximus]
MVLKQCHPRLKLFVFNHPEKKCCDPSAFNRDRVGSSLATASTLAAVNTSPSSPRFVCEEPRGEKRAAGRKMLHLSAGTQVSVRELSTSTRAFQYDLKPDIPNSEGRKLFFDTHAVVRLFEENGFTTQQAEVMVKVLVRMTNSNMDVIYNDMVTKTQQEIMLQRVMSQIAAVKKDMIILEKSEFSALLAESEKLKIQLLLLKVQLADVMNKVRSDTILDMNLEKSRVKELKAQHERKLLETRTEIMEMTSEQDRHLTQTNMKIDTEVAGLKTMLESHKLDTIKYLAGSVFTCLTVVLGFYRIWM